ncbi:MAG: methyltransferase domain-containing protein [Acidimicrobiales bacterium]|nr:methyltransferase domain-containing protein [Acidimicrobiales bacterium]
MTAEPEYVHGHHASVLRSHKSRTIANSAAYVAARLQPGMRVLDVGCGPGNLTAEIAGRVAPGEVIGIDASDTIVAEAARDHGEAASFALGDVYALDYPDDGFDLVHAHQVLQHLDRPIEALREMRRVTTPGGIVAARDADYGAMTWAPANEGMDRWMDLYQRMTADLDHDANAGRHLLGWAQQAGFTDITVSSSTWEFADPDSRGWWSGVWADRVLQSSYGDIAVRDGLATRPELDEIAAAWRDWATRPDGFFLCPHVEIVAVA